jgi:hypothetical protein
MLWGCAVAVLMLNEAAVPSNVLARAQMEASRIYRGVGVNLVWIHEAGDHYEYQPAAPKPSAKAGFTMKIVRAALRKK